MELVRRLTIVGTSIRAATRNRCQEHQQGQRSLATRVCSTVFDPALPCAPTPPCADLLLGRECGFPAPAFCCCYRCRTCPALQDSWLTRIDRLSRGLRAHSTPVSRPRAGCWRSAEAHRRRARSREQEEAGHGPRAPLGIHSTHMSTLLIEHATKSRSPHVLHEPLVRISAGCAHGGTDGLQRHASGLDLWVPLQE